MLNYKEIWSVLAKQEEHYNELRENGNEHQKKYAHYALFALAQTDKALRNKLKEKYKRKKNEDSRKSQKNFWEMW